MLEGTAELPRLRGYLAFFWGKCVSAGAPGHCRGQCVEPLAWGRPWHSRGRQGSVRRAV